MLSAICFNLDQSKILASGNGVIKLFHKAMRADDKMFSTLSLTKQHSSYINGYVGKLPVT